jgi:hypothetical protein
MNQKEMKLKRPSRIFTNRRRPVLFSALTMLVALALAVPVLANPPGPGTGNLDPYQPTDAAPDCNPSTPPAPTLDLNSPTAAGPTVAKTCDPPGAPTQNVTVNWISDTISGSQSDNAWGQGDKSDCFLAKTGGVDGACVTQVTGIGASKTDLQYHGISLAQGSNGHFYLYSGIKRLQAGGITSSNANYNVEVNQNLPAYQPAAPICPLPASQTGSCNMWRSPGDLTLMTDWGGNQSSCGVPTPAICAYVWIDFSAGTGKTPSPAGSTCFSAQSAPCWGLLPGGSAQLSNNLDLAAGSINSTATTQPSTFSEIAVDLTQAGLVGAGACETFNNEWAHSRSSSSFTAELKDFIFGNVTLSTCTSTTTLLHQTDSTGADFNPAITGLELTVSPGAYVKDVATVTGTGATGSVDFRLYASSAACIADTTGTGGTDIGSSTLSGGSATSATHQFNTVGNFYWRAFYTGNLSPSASPCNEIVHVVQVETAISTSPFYYPNDSATLSAPNGGGTLTGTIDFSAFVATASPAATALANCTANTSQGLLFTEPQQAVSGVGPYTTTNTTHAVSTNGQVYFRVTFTSTNGSQKGRNSICVENINATLTGDTPGTSGNTP